MPLTPEQMRQFADVFTAVKTGYVDAIDDKKIFGGCLNGMVAGVDPDSGYLDAEAFNELTVRPDSAGVGLELSIVDGNLKVVSPIDGTPAEQAGVRSGDLITRIDGNPTKGLTLNEAVKRMRGRPGTELTLTVARTGEVEAQTFALKRAVIRVLSVKSRMLEPGYAYLRISQFQSDTGALLVKRLQEFFRQGRIDGLIVDLRNNPGGLLQSGIGVAAAFLPAQALILSMEGRAPDATRRYLAVPEDYLRGGLTESDYLKQLPGEARTVPLVVLVNGGSAAASEIVAGALQDHKRAVIVGSRTYGRTSVQTILPLSANTAVKVTTSRWRTPNGRSLQPAGLAPDVVVADRKDSAVQSDAADDPPLGQALALLKNQTLVARPR